MAFKIESSKTPYFPATKSKKRADYLSFIRQLPCCVTGRNDVEAAHLSAANSWYGHYGRARGTKAPDRFALPLCKAEHDRQHSMNETAYWASVGINAHELAVTLFGIYSDYDEYEATERAEARIRAGINTIILSARQK